MDARFQRIAQGTVYLLHFESKFAGQKRHYVGFTHAPVASRFKKHTDGSSETDLTGFAARKGIGCLLAKVWENTTSEFERKLKREKNLKRHCPICAAELVPPQAGSSNVKRT